MKPYSRVLYYLALLFYFVAATALLSPIEQSSAHEEPVPITLALPALAPALSSPANGATIGNTQPTFTWASIAGSSSYTLQVDDENSFAFPYQVNTTVSGTSYTYTTSPLANKVWYWRVKATNQPDWSATWSFTVQGYPLAPVVVSPTHGGSVNTLRPTFTWQAATGATIYQIEISDNSLLAGIDFVNTTTASTSYTLTKDLYGSTWYWRVRSGTGANSWGQWSTTHSFTLNTPLAMPAGPYYPDYPNERITDTTPTFGWGAVAGATGYELQIDECCIFSSPVTFSVATNSYTPPLAEGSWYWRVRAVNSPAASQWTTGIFFEIDATPIASLHHPDEDEILPTSQLVTFDYGSIYTPVVYNIEIDRQADFGSDERIYIEGRTVTTLQMTLGDGVWYWRVQACSAPAVCGEWGASRFQVGGSFLPVLLSPDDRRIVREIDTELSWQDDYDQSYLLQMDDDPAFDSPEVNTSVVGTAYSLCCELPDGDWYWRVARNNGEGLWSAIWLVKLRAAPAPTLVFPTNGSANGDKSPAFSWQPAAGMTEFRFELASTPDFTTLVDTYVGNSQFYTPAQALAAGNWYWRVRAYYTPTAAWGRWSTSYSYTVTLVTPTINSPAASTAETTPTLGWTAVSEATSYQVYVQTLSGTLVINESYDQTVCENSTCSVISPVTLAAGENYALWVRALSPAINSEWSARYDFTITATPPAQPVLTAPTGASSDTTPDYVWAKVSGATSYRLFISDAYGTTLLDTTYTDLATLCPAESCAITPDLPLADGTYSAWVQALNAGGGTWSNAQSFTVSSVTPPATPVLTAPAAGTSDTTPAYGWNEVSGATSYRVYVQSISSGAVVVDSTVTSSVCSGSACSLEPAVTLTINESYNLWVQAINVAGSAWSNPLLFTVTPSVPAATTVTAPTGGITDTTPAYAWNEVANATVYRLFVQSYEGVVMVDQVYTTAACSGGTCAADPGVELSLGMSYNAWVLTGNGGGNGPWSAASSFYITTGAPAAPVQIAPTGTGAATQPTYQWNEAAGATQYRLYVQDAIGTVITNEVVTSSVCTAGLCSYTPTPTLTDGTGYTWWVLAANDGGGAWSNAAVFVPGSVPGTTTLTAPVSPASVTQPTYEWTEVSGATNYRLYVATSGGTVVLDQVFPSSNCTAGVCSVTPAVTLTPAETYQAWVLASNAVGNGSWSAGYFFAVNP